MGNIMKIKAGICILLFIVMTGGVGPLSAQTATLSPQKPIVTFIELGSVNCIPCKAMQPIMEEVRNKYPGQIRVIFHDVWTPKGQPYGQFFKIKVIPTQIFLDKNGKEYFRHEGFFPAEELYKILAKGGVKL